MADPTAPVTLTLRPAEGRLVPQADGRPWPAEGLAVVPDQYIRRRLADGDLVPVAAPRERDVEGPAAAPADDETPARKRR